MTTRQRRLRRVWRNLRADLIATLVGVVLVATMALALHGMAP
jgi:hypothetical protein